MGEAMINIVEVTSYEQAEVMRQIRNECRSFMTGSQHEISAEDQRLWFRFRDQSSVLPFLLVSNADRWSAAIGYGLIRQVPALYGIANAWWVSGGLRSEWRGRGYGKVLFEALASRVNYGANLGLGAVCWLAVFENNVSARKTYESLGFIVDSAAISDGDQPILIMRRP